MSSDVMVVVSVEDESERVQTEFKVKQNDICIIYTDNISKLCRTCMNSEEILIPILSITFENNIKLVDLLQECASIQVNSLDKLPLNICQNCCDEILRIYKFRKRCSEVEDTLKELLETSEQSVDDDPNILDDYKETNSPKSIVKIVEEETVDNKKTVIKKVHICKVCEMCFTKRKELLAHRKETNHIIKVKRPLFECPACSKKFTKDKLNRHMTTHTKETPYLCEFCSRAFSRRINLKRHIKIHTGERPHICHFCGKSFIQLKHLVKHMETHTSTEEITNFNCKDCGRVFKRIHAYITHRKKHNLTNDEEIKEEEHIMSTDTGFKPHICDFCSKRFAYSSHLRYHLRIHTGEKPFFCTYCEKRFARKDNFNKHVITHTREKPYTCAICRKGFSYLSFLTKHLKETHDVIK